MSRPFTSSPRRNESIEPNASFQISHCVSDKESTLLSSAGYLGEIFSPTVGIRESVNMCLLFIFFSIEV